MDLGLIKEKIQMRLKQQEIAFKLIPSLYPGYPRWRALDRGIKLFRESNPSKAGLAYDLLPTCDSFERLEEVILIKVPVTHEHDKGGGLCVSIPVKHIRNYAQRQTKRKPDDKDIRLHMIFWQSNRLAWQPVLSELIVGSNERNQWTKEDKDIIDKGYRHIDITDKINWESILQQTGENVELKCDCWEHITQVSICEVWCKSPLELINHLYLQTASTHAARAIENSPCQDQHVIQRQILDVIRGFPPLQSLTLSETQTLFEALMGSVDADRKAGVRKDDNDNECDGNDLVLMDQSVSLHDTLLLTRIEYPARGIHCTHLTCFDARIFFLCQLRKRTWKCYICGVQYKSIQDLYIDYEMTQALRKYPTEERLVYRDGTFVPKDQDAVSTKQAPESVYHIYAVDDDDEDIDGLADDDGGDADSEYNKKRKAI
ncbi:hypothetical protein BX666DRAFT_2031094 [Dichotomocladium elegans]|nr:hypothetical protein BX666DRAFT_2031094 [Dichotomocladium elegans]